MNRYAAANRAISAALAASAASAADRGGTDATAEPDAMADLDEAERRLTAVDTVLADALAENERLRQATQTALHPEPLPGSPEEK